MEDLNFDDYDFNNYSYNYSLLLNDAVEQECSWESSIYFDSIFIPVIYSLALAMGLVGNGLVLVILWKKRLSMNTTDIFIFQLSLAGILLLLTLPFWAVEAVKGWIFGGPLCKLIGTLFKISFYCGIFMLSCISLDRCLSIIHAVQTYSRKRRMVIHCCCLMLWLFCLLFSIPDLISLQVIKDSRRQDRIECVAVYPSYSWYLATHLLFHILSFILPGLIMLFCYSCILLRHCSQCKQTKRDFRFVIALVLAFFIHLTPYNVTRIIDTVQTNTAINPVNLTSCKNTTALDIALTVTSTLAYLHCCVIPVLYVGLKVPQKSSVCS
ncbi:hypothetical protein Q8A67_007897 [Cirrhinus molitorella]|uniref:C-X-C chemokine receptor type 3 n=1 Tax=Cirrhinus molitorella TaxID=172907 RepID=A0AA88Q323_9TELE|nr:hypothetical protein Q8A67_007897 [Cirrhinus molitorella]